MTGVSWTCWTRRKSRGSETAASGGWRPAYMDSLATLASPRSATASATSSDLRPGDPRRLAGGDYRQVAANRQPLGNPRPEDAFEVKFGGHTETYTDGEGGFGCAGSRSVVKASPTTRPSSATRSPNATRCGCGRPKAVESFDFQAFNVGDYYGAVNEKVVSENITKVLYPNDEHAKANNCASSSNTSSVSCSLQDMIRIHHRGSARCQAAHEH